MIQLTYKIKLAEKKPYRSCSAEEFTALTREQEDKVANGEHGIYIAREIAIDGRPHYFPYLDIDGDPNLSGDERINSAIQFAQLTYNCFKELRVEDKFIFIATGGSGFRAISRLVLSRDRYLAFVELVKHEMPFIHDIQPIENLEMPHQLIAYKGSSLHNDRTLINRHSMVIGADRLTSENFSARDYKRLTVGYPKPRDVLGFVEWFTSFEVVSDLSVLGGLGAKVAEYAKALSEEKIKSFSFAGFKRRHKSVALNVMKDKLLAKGIQAKVEKRGSNRDAISFQGLPCPACRIASHNAYAYPPHYTLFCHSTNCRAHTGMPFHQWATNIEFESVEDATPRYDLGLRAPTEFVPKDAAKNLIKEAIAKEGSHLLLITPGVGKTRETIKCLEEQVLTKKIIYSSPSKKLKEEAYQACLDNTANPEKIFLLKARDNVCLRKEELLQVTEKGFSPAMILCRSCEQEKECGYYGQRENAGPGIYFVTHQMLDYLPASFTDADLLIIDENLEATVNVKSECSTAQLRTLLKILPEGQQTFLNDIIQMANNFASQVATDSNYGQILNGKRITGPGSHEDSILEIMARKNGATTLEVRDTIALIMTQIDNNFSHQRLYDTGVNFLAVEWLRGLINDTSVSYIEVAADNKISFKVKRIANFPFPDTPTKILDATGNLKLAEILTQKTIEEVKADVHWESKRVHIRKSMSRFTLARATDKDLKALLKDSLSQISGSKILVITYLKINDSMFTSRIVTLCKKIEPTKTFEAHHFQGERGINKFRDCESVLVIGSPYSNLTDNWQDAWIYFPEETDKDLRDYWSQLKMNWELIQGIHRIRPIDKAKVDIVLVADTWPSLLPEPDQVIETSYKQDWLEEVVDRLRPLVKKLGFLSKDMASLVSVSQKGTKYSEQILHKFIFLKDLSNLLSDSESVFHHGTQVEMREEIDRLIDVHSAVGLSKNIRKHIIGTIYTNTKNTLPGNNLDLSVVSQLLPFFKSTNSSQLTLSNGNQWSEVETYFLTEYPHFSKFEIKLPHLRGQKVNGIGNLALVRKFYESFNNLPPVFDKVDLQTLKVKHTGTHTLSLPDDVMVARLDEESEILWVAHKQDIEMIWLKNGQADFGEHRVLANISPGTQIVTNNGKLLAKEIMRQNLNRPQLHDVVMNHMILNNRKDLPRSILDQELFHSYGLNKDADVVLGMHQLYDIWQQQQSAIEQGGHRNIIDLEHEVLWVTAKIETTGIPVDTHGLRHYLDSPGLNSKTATQIKGWLKKTDSDSRYHDEINQVGQVSGRFTSTIHNVEKPSKGPLRSFFKAKPGYKFVRADFKQQEVRLIAALANDPEYLAIFNGGKDIYTEIAQELTDRLESSQAIPRALAKGIVLGLNNCLAADSLQGLLESAIPDTVPTYAVTAFVSEYQKRFAKIFEWRNEVVRDAHKNGFVSTKLGRRRWLPGPAEDPSIISHVMQGTAADGFKNALLAVEKNLENSDARIVHILHDEIIVEAGADIADHVLDIVRTCMENAFQGMFLSMPFPVDASICDSWGESVPQPAPLIPTIAMCRLHECDEFEEVYDWKIETYRWICKVEQVETYEDTPCCVV